jgi:hypothetical protein
MTRQVVTDLNVAGSLSEQSARVYSPNNVPGAYDPGSVTVATERFLLQYAHLKLASTERMTVAGTARVVVEDHADQGAFGEPGIVLGRPKAPALSFTVPDGYILDVIGHLTLGGAVRATLQGLADLILTDDFGMRSRIVLAGRG